MTAGTGTSRWGTEVTSLLADRRPRSVDQLAASTGARRGELLTFLTEHPHLLQVSTGWVDALRLADGVALTHELSAAEQEADVLAADDDLALWAVLAEAGLDLATGGRVRAHPMTELPDGLRSDLPAGGGLIGQGLVGPRGWLAGFRAGDLLEVRLRGGVLEVRATEQPELRVTQLTALFAAFAAAAVEALERFGEGEGEIPAADIAAVLAELILTQPEVIADPLPPLGSMLRRTGWETFGGHVGVVGTPWNLTRARGLDRLDAVAATTALGLLLTWGAEQTDGPRTIETLRSALSARDVLRYLADEVERRVAMTGTRVDAVLDRLATTAGTPTERAAVALLSARAAEGAGDSMTAQGLIDQALSGAPDLQPALMDAAEYAACRGDLKAADAYLRRVQHPIAQTLRHAVRSVLTAPLSSDQPGRNRPCPCGSGRKFKVCCQRSLVPPLATRSELLYTLVTTYAQRPASGEELGFLINLSGQDPRTAMLCTDLLLTHEGIADRFLRARGAWLRDDERALMETWATIPIELFETREVRHGAGATVRALPAGPPIDLRDRAFSTCIQRLDLFCGRILTDGSHPQLLSLPAPVLRNRRVELLELLASKPSAQQLAAFFGPQPEPCLRNSDGHDYLDAEIVLEVPDAETAWQRLSEGLVQTDGNTLDHQVDRDGKIVSLGQITRVGHRWELHANSRERLDALESTVRAEAPSARLVSRRVERVGGEPPVDGRTVRLLEVDNYLTPADPHLDERQARQDLLRTMQESWLDTPNSLGMTPRQAADVGGGPRAELDAMLDDMQWYNNRLRDQGRPPTMDVAWIRAELDLRA